MNYKTGQALIYLANNEPQLGFIVGEDSVMGYPVTNLLGNHFDLFNLVSKGEAIDVTTNPNSGE